MKTPRQSTVEELQRLHRVKSTPPPAAGAFGLTLLEFHKQSVIKRQGKIAKLAEAWGRIVPETISDHCSLEGFSKGTLIVLVDSSSHLYDIKQLLLSGLERQLLLACKSTGLKKISLKAGRWYEDGDNRRVRFDSKK